MLGPIHFAVVETASMEALTSNVFCCILWRPTLKLAGGVSEEDTGLTCHRTPQSSLCGTSALEKPISSVTIAPSTAPHNRRLGRPMLPGPDPADGFWRSDLQCLSKSSLGLDSPAQPRPARPFIHTLQGQDRSHHHHQPNYL